MVLHDYEVAPSASRYGDARLGARKGSWLILLRKAIAFPKTIWDPLPPVSAALTLAQTDCTLIAADHFWLLGQETRDCN
jgi:hypothetical protein